jgi:Mg-chelatase subunit ChlD
VPGFAYLPILLRQACRPAEVHTDVVLVLDTSASMLEPSGTSTKLAAAQAAARDFVRLLNLGDDQAAVVSFNSAASVAEPLTIDRDRLEGTIAGLSTAAGTRIDLALAAARAELASGRPRSGNNRVVILLTDGRQDGGDASLVLGESSALKRAGALVYAIGLGTDVDEDLLRAVASAPGMFLTSPTGNALAAIYASIAYELPCPGGAPWEP